MPIPDFRARPTDPGLLRELARPRDPVARAVGGLTAGLERGLQLTEQISKIKERRRMSREIARIVTTPEFKAADKQAGGMLSAAFRASPVQGLQLFGQLERARTAREQFRVTKEQKETELELEKRGLEIKEKIGERKYETDLLKLMQASKPTGQKMSPIETDVGKRLGKKLIEGKLLTRPEAQFMQAHGIPMQKAGFNLFRAALGLVKRVGKFELGIIEPTAPTAVKPDFVAQSDWDAATPEQRKQLLDSLR